MVDPQGLRQEYRYGQHGEVLRHILPNGAEWRYRYNTGHQICEIIAPDNGVTLLTQDIFGRLREVQDALGHTTRYAPSPHHANPAGSISKINLPDGVSQTVAYDSEKRVAAVTDGAGKTVRYEYGAFDLLTALIRPDGQRLTFSYDKLTRLESVTNALGHTWRYTRDVAGQIIAETDFTGHTIRQGMPVRQRAGRQTRIFRPEEVSDIPRPTLAGIDRAYQYDAALNLVSASDDNGSLNYVVNGNRQVVSVSQGRTLKEYYHYDASGCLTQRQTGEQHIVHDDIYQRGHRLRRLGQNWYEYDLAGRMTARRIQREGFRPEYTRFSWDSQDRLTGVKDAQGNRWQYRYDALGRRTEKRCEKRDSG